MDVSRNTKRFFAFCLIGTVLLTFKICSDLRDYFPAKGPPTVIVLVEDLPGGTIITDDNTLKVPVKNPPRNAVYISDFFDYFEKPVQVPVKKGDVLLTTDFRKIPATR